MSCGMLELTKLDFLKLGKLYKSDLEKHMQNIPLALIQDFADKRLNILTPAPLVVHVTNMRFVKSD